MSEDIPIATSRWSLALGSVRERLARGEAALLAAVVRGCYRMAVALLRLLPIRALLALGAGVGRLVGGFSGRELSFSLTQLAFAFAPEPNSNQPNSNDQANKIDFRAIALGAFAHAGEYLAEVHLIDRLMPLVASGSIASIEGGEVIEELLAAKKPCVCIGSHAGPFEFSAAYMATRGIPITVFAQSPNQAALKPVLGRVHAAAGFEVIWRDDQGAAAKILRGMRDGRALCALLDQDTKLENRFVPLFGLPAAHPVLPIKLAIKYDLPIVLCSTARLARMRYRIRYKRIRYDQFLVTWDRENPPITDDQLADEHSTPEALETVSDTVSREPTLEERQAAIEKTGKRAEAVIRANSARAVARTEAAINYVLLQFSASAERELREYPEQWFWWHRRWRRRPGVDYHKHPEALRSSTEYLMWLSQKRNLKVEGKPFDND